MNKHVALIIAVLLAFFASNQSVCAENVSIVDYLKSQAKDGSFASRCAIAKEKGITAYKGTRNQNLKLLKLLETEAQAKPQEKKLEPEDAEEVETAIAAVKIETKVEAVIRPSLEKKMEEPSTSAPEEKTVLKVMHQDTEQTARAKFVSHPRLVAIANGFYVSESEHQFVCGCIYIGGPLLAILIGVIFGSRHHFESRKWKTYRLHLPTTDGTAVSFSFALSRFLESIFKP